MNLYAAFRCTSGCAGEYPLDSVIYTCPSCGNLLEVVHDVAALAHRPVDEWRQLFDSRERLRTNASPVWNKKEWICPLVRDDRIVSFGEGGTPLRQAPRFSESIGAGDVWIKQCGESPTGSFKDLGMTVLVSMVRHMVSCGQAIRAVACASTGDTSAALAAYAAAAGIPSFVILPRGQVTAAQLVQPLASGATVLAIDTDFDGCMAIVQRLAVNEGVYLANSMNSLRIEGQKTVGIEIVQQFGWQAPDTIVIPGGNLGNVTALGAGLDLMLALGVIGTRPRLVVAQAASANPLYLAYRNAWRYEPIVAQPTAASAIRIGNPVSVHKAMATLRRYNGMVGQATEQELADAAALADREGFFACPHTGVALAVTRQLAAAGQIGRDERVVVISTANGLKFAEFKTGYHTGALTHVSPSHANRPIELPNDYDAVRAAVDHAASRP